MEENEWQRWQRKRSNQLAEGKQKSNGQEQEETKDGLGFAPDNNAMLAMQA